MGIFLLWLFFGIFTALIASSRNRSVVGWFFIGFLFGPFGLLFAFFMKDGKELGDYESFSLGRKKKKKAEFTSSDTKKLDDFFEDTSDDIKQASNMDSTEKLIKLSELLEKGLLTQEEFDAQKAKLLQ